MTTKDVALHDFPSLTCVNLWHSLLLCMFILITQGELELDDITLLSINFVSVDFYVFARRLAPPIFKGLTTERWNLTTYSQLRTANQCKVWQTEKHYSQIKPYNFSLYWSHLNFISWGGGGVDNKTTKCVWCHDVAKVHYRTLQLQYYK